MSWSEESRRYIDSDPEFFWPETWRKRAENVKQGSSEETVVPVWFDGYGSFRGSSSPGDFEDVVLTQYNRLLEQGVAPEQARMILPQNMYTTCVWTGSLLSFVHVIHERTTAGTQQETKSVALQIKEILQGLYPISLDALLE